MDLPLTYAVPPQGPQFYIYDRDARALVGADLGWPLRWPTREEAAQRAIVMRRLLPHLQVVSETEKWAFPLVRPPAHGSEQQPTPDPQ